MIIWDDWYKSFCTHEQNHPHQIHTNGINHKIRCEATLLYYISLVFLLSLCHSLHAVELSVRETISPMVMNITRTLSSDIRSCCLYRVSKCYIIPSRGVHIDWSCFWFLSVFLAFWLMLSFIPAHVKLCITFASGFWLLRY